MGSPEKPHALCIPLPFQSHINAMLKLAKLLYFKGFYVTFVNSDFNHRKVLKSRGPGSLDGLPDFRFKTIPDGLPPCDVNASQDFDALCDSVIKNFPDILRNVITKLNEASGFSDTPRLTCIVSDAITSSTLEVAEEIGIPGVLLWTMSASYLMSNLHCRHLVERGLIPLKGKSDLTNGYLDMFIDLIPGMRDIRLKDLPSCFWEDDDPSENFLIRQLQRIGKASAIIINTFDALENEVLEAMKPLLPHVYTIGPLQLLLQEISNSQLNSVAFNIWKEDEESFKWLDSKPPNSVLYISFGSSATLTLEQFLEFAWGIANSKYPFLWVIRPDLVNSEAANFLPEFIKVTADRGIISGWCAQEQVLCHSSTAAFLTHSGWNSIMDTVCGGVPVINWSFFADQQCNSRYACFHWGIGIEIDKNVKRDEVEGLVRELMEGEKGWEMKKKAMEWKKSAEESTKLGGTSYENLDRIVEALVQKKLE